MSAVLYLGALAILQDLFVRVFGSEEASASSVQVLKAHKEKNQDKAKPPSTPILYNSFTGQAGGWKYKWDNGVKTER